MNTILGLKKIAKYIDSNDLGKLEQGAALYKRHSNIQFKILTADDGQIIIGADQGKHMAQNYLTQKDLIARCKDLFSQFLPNHKIHVRATPFQEHFISEIDGKWVQKQMIGNNVKVKNIEAETGIDKSNISAWVNGLKPMSQVTKAMFYFYFKSKGASI